MVKKLTNDFYIEVYNLYENQGIKVGSIMEDEDEFGLIIYGMNQNGEYVCTPCSIYYEEYFGQKMKSVRTIQPKEIIEGNFKKIRDTEDVLLNNLKKSFFFENLEWETYVRYGELLSKVKKGTVIKFNNRYSVVCEINKESNYYLLLESFDGDIDETMLESSLGKVNHSVVFVTRYNLISLDKNFELVGNLNNVDNFIAKLRLVGKLFNDMVNIFE